MGELVLLASGLFLLLELSARVHLFGWAGLVPARINSVHGLPQTGFLQRSSEPRLVFELRPDVDGFFHLARFTTNARGMRDHEASLAKPENTFRVAVVGSSFALPTGVELGEAFHSRLEERLSRERAPTRYEFLNFAVGMYSPRQSLAMLELRALDFDPDLVLFTVTRLAAPAMLSRGTAPRARGAKGLEFRRSYPVLQSFLVRLVEQRAGADPEAPGLHVGLLERAFVALAEQLGPAPGGDPSPAASGDLRHRARGPETRSVVEQLAAIGERSGLPIVVVRLEIDAEREVAEEPPLAERCAELGLHYVDTRGAFRGRRARDLWIHGLDPHPNAEAHGIFARELAGFLQERELLEAPPS